MVFLGGESKAMVRDRKVRESKVMVIVIDKHMVRDKNRDVVKVKTAGDGCGQN